MFSAETRHFLQYTPDEILLTIASMVDRPSLTPIQSLHWDSKGDNYELRVMFLNAKRAWAAGSFASFNINKVVDLCAFAGMSYDYLILL